MPLFLEEVKKIANLARLELTAEELALYREQLSAVLDYASRLNELNTDDVPPTASAVAKQNVMREDVIQSSLPIEDVLYNAARKSDDQFQIQPVLDDA